MVKEITELEELTDILEKNNVVVVDYWATWCGPCKMIAPFYKELDIQHDDVYFLKVDVDEADDLASAQGIQCLPTFQVYKNKELFDTITGANKDKLKEVIEHSLKENK
jgi:thioredoxin 1